MLRRAKFLPWRRELGGSGAEVHPGGGLGAFRFLEPIFRKTERLPTPGCARFRDRIFIPSDPRAGTQEVTHSAATGALRFPVGTGGRSGTDFILSAFTRVFGTSVRVIRAHTLPSGINVPKRPCCSSTVRLPSVEPSCKSGFELRISDLKVRLGHLYPSHWGDQRGYRWPSDATRPMRSCYALLTSLCV